SLFSLSLMCAMPASSRGLLIERVICRVKSQLRSAVPASAAAVLGADAAGGGRKAAALHVPPAPPGTLQSTVTAGEPGIGRIVATAGAGVTVQRRVCATQSSLRHVSPTVHGSPSSHGEPVGRTLPAKQVKSKQAPESWHGPAGGPHGVPSGAGVHCAVQHG